jgi:predicted exporter
VRPRQAWLVVAALFGAVLFAALVFRAAVVLRSDLAELLPQGGTEAARLMLDELRSGPTTGLILIGLDGAKADTLARIDKTMTAALIHSGLFTFVENGQQPLDEADLQFLFAHRYLLSPLTTARAFEPVALHRDFQRLLSELGSSAAPLIEQYGLADPPGAFLEIARRWTGGSPLREINGVWFAADRDRALILASTRANGLELIAQAKVARAIAAGFAAAGPGNVRLLVAGPAVFARAAAVQIAHDVRLLSIVSTVLVTGLLIWRFRSPLVLAAIAVPIILSVSIAALVVQGVFGFVHGIAFGFGMTMLGVTADYPVLLIGHRKRAEAAPATLRRIGPTFDLTVAAAVLGLAGMLFAGFPGLSQLGTFAVVGVLTAAAVTRWGLPPLIVAADLAPVSAGNPAHLLRIERLRGGRAWGLLPVAGALIYLAATGGPHFETDAAGLTPIPAQARALDAKLRAELGAPDVNQALVLTAPDAEAVLRREEALAPILETLQHDRIIKGVEMAARYLPSVAAQLARQAQLPAAGVLERNIAAARQGLPFRAHAFGRFQADVAASRAMAPVTLAELTNPIIVARLRALLFRRGVNWCGLVVPKGVAAPRRLAAQLRSVPGATYINVHAETDAMVSRYNRRAGRWLVFGAAAATILLVVRLRDRWRVARVVFAIAAAELVTIALLTALGQRLSLVHIVSLQFVGGIGLDYALFFSRPQLDEEERARTFRTLITCNAMTLLTFGVLVFCRTPLLQQVGLTTAIGAVAAMAFGFLFAGPYPAPDRPFGQCRAR